MEVFTNQSPNSTVVPFEPERKDKERVPYERRKYSDQQKREKEMHEVIAYRIESDQKEKLAGNETLDQDQPDPDYEHVCEVCNAEIVKAQKRKEMAQQNSTVSVGPEETTGWDGLAPYWNGKEYTGELIFYPDVDVDVDNKESFTIHDDDLVKEMDRLLHPHDDPILNAEIRIRNLSEANTSDKTNIYHAIVILETRYKYYSIEKGLQGVELKQAEKYDSVALPHKTRRCHKKIARARDDVTMNQLIDHIHKEKLLKKRYDIRTSNCKWFAASVFNFVQNGDVSDWEPGWY